MTARSVKMLVALWASSHPGPTLVVTVLAAALAVAAGVDAWRIVVLTVAVFAGQLSVGLSNDAFDAARDRSVGRRDKPVAGGDISPGTAWTAAAASLLVALLLSVLLGPGLLGAHALALGAAWSYNAGLKASPLSILPFILSFGLFPSFATLAQSQPQLAAGWAWVAGAALGAAVHLTNVLPDLDDDADTGIRGLPHRVGLRTSVALAGAAVLTGAASVTAGPSGADLLAVSAVSWVFFGLVVVVVLVSWALVRAGSPGRVLFRLVMVAALLLAVQLVVTGGSLPSEG